MFKTIFAVFALIAAAFAAPSPNPSPIPTLPAVQVASAPAHFVSSYSAPVTYGGYHVPVAYSGLSAAAFPTHSAYSYETPLIYKR